MRIIYNGRGWGSREKMGSGYWAVGNGQWGVGKRGLEHRTLNIEHPISNEDEVVE